MLKLFTWLLVDQFKLSFGGGGGGGPQTSTTNTANIPEYAKPYVENMLGSAQTQIYNDDMTTFRPYTPFSKDPNDYTASYSPLQQNAQQGAANLQTPSQFGAATNLTGQAALGSLGAADQSGGLQQQALGYGNAGALYGGAGAEYGAQGSQQAAQAAQQAALGAGQYGAQGNRAAGQAAGLSSLYGNLGSQAGQQASGLSSMYGGLGAQTGLGYGQQAQDPNAVQGFMNPYIQASLQPQLAEMERQYGISGAQQQSQAAKSGAFGGSREALMAAENQRNKNTAMNQVIGQGYNQAFNNAQQQMAQAAQLGMQGAGMGLQGAGQAGSQAMQGYGMGLTGANQAGNLRLQGAQTGLQGVGQQLAAGNLGLAGTAQGMQGAGMGMQGAQAGMQGVQGAIGAGQYGLQGLGQAGQMGNQLANIGQQQLAAQQGIISTQNQMGGQMQAQEQQKINQQIQDYATQQQYPFMQLGIMNSLLRGLPLQTTTTQSYQAQPAIGQQALGLGLGALGASKAFA
jgi:hypothetical protein